MTLQELVEKDSEFHNRSEAEKIKLFMWYLHAYKNLERISNDDIRMCYEEIHHERPSSLSPFLKSLENRSPKVVLRDSQGIYLEGKNRREYAAKYGQARPTQAISTLLRELPNKVPDGAERKFIDEAIACIEIGAARAAIVLGWCAVIYHLQRKIETLGFNNFNSASTILKNQSSGKFKRWNKEFAINSVGELQAIFDTDLIIVVEGMGLIDDNQAQRLEICFKWRCHSAHPGDAPVGDAHVIAFFTDVVTIVLANPKVTA